MEFIGRKEELKRINKIINTNGLTFSLIYGRRRVGKSELIKEVLRNTDIKSIYYECKQVSEINNCNSLSDIVSSIFDLPKMAYSDIESLLTFIFELSKKEKLVLVLDEYPYLKESIKGIDSIFQSLIDKYKDEANISLIILGSYVEVMKTMLEHSNPLYGRVDLSINLKQMDYYESGLFYPNYSAEDKIRIYSVFGGIPYYNRLIDDSKSVRENIIELIASKDARLENEVSMYLNAELSKITNANETFEALAKGYCRFNDILSQSHVSSGPTLIDVLEKLIKMEVVVKEAPINDSNNRRKISYRICDNLSSFYYRYIFKYNSQLSIMDSETFYDLYIAKDFEEKYVPVQFENICRQYLIRNNLKGKFKPVLEKVGKYYYDNPKEHKNGEFDVVSEDANGYIFYEAKFRKNPLSDSLINEEIKQIKETGLNVYKYVFFSRSSFKTDREDVELIKLEKMY
ncbi:MAG: ATP-binding protein [Erysipelotrichaceae bacterium]|nr:ATP-binding protein [Erysipelotrichaceae bacterium]